MNTDLRWIRHSNVCPKNSLMMILDEEDVKNDSKVLKLSVMMGKNRGPPMGQNLKIMSKVLLIFFANGHVLVRAKW